MINPEAMNKARILCNPQYDKPVDPRNSPTALRGQFPDKGAQLESQLGIISPEPITENTGVMGGDRENAMFQSAESRMANLKMKIQNQKMGMQQPAMAYPQSQQQQQYYQQPAGYAMPQQPQYTPEQMQFIQQQQYAQRVATMDYEPHPVNENVSQRAGMIDPEKLKNNPILKEVYEHPIEQHSINGNGQISPSMIMMNQLGIDPNAPKQQAQPQYVPQQQPINEQAVGGIRQIIKEELARFHDNMQEGKIDTMVMPQKEQGTMRFIDRKGNIFEATFKKIGNVHDRKNK